MVYTFHEGIKKGGKREVLTYKVDTIVISQYN